MNEVRLEQVPVQSFAELVGSAFMVEIAPSYSLSLKLTAVTEPRTSAPTQAGSQYETFSLFFEGPADRPLAQRIYTFIHSKLGSFDLFIVPVAREQGRLQYEAVFNRLRTQSKL